MSHIEVINELTSRGEKHITFREDGVIVSRHGQNTINFWFVDDKGQLICFDCKTSY